MGVGAGAGVTTGVGVGLTAGFGAATFTPLFQTSFFPLFTQVYLVYPETAEIPSFEHVAPAFTAADA